MLTIDGLVTGIDTESVISGLLQIQQTQLDRIEVQQSEVLQQQAAFGTLEAGLLSLRNATSGLASSSNSPFLRKVTTVSDETVLAATASSKASQGSYRVTVNSVARAHQVASGGFADAEAEITTGTLELRTGSGDLTTITIDSSNNTLTGLVEAINDADSGVSASLISDPSGGANSQRILLSSRDSGTANQISVTNNLAASSGSATQVTFDFGNPVQAATDASITLGSGAGAIAVSSENNQFDDLISGVRIDLLNASSGDEIEISIRQDTDAAVTAVSEFVEGFNAFMSQVDNLTAFNEGGENGVLLGNRSVIALQQRIRTAALDSVAGISSQLNTLSAVGISVNDNGQLSFDSSRLSSIMNGEVDGLGPEQLADLFATQGDSTNAGVRFLLAGSDTVASSKPYEVDITQAAERAVATATSAVSGPVTITSANREVRLSLSGVEATVFLPEGTFTDTELAASLEATINESTEFGTRNVRVSSQAGVLQIETEAFGSSSSLTVQSGSALADLGFSGGEAGVGKDVEGRFLVNGVVEEATGRGRILSGDEGNANTADLQVEVTLDAASVVAGVDAELTVTRGVAATLDKAIGDLISADTGLLSTLDAGFDQELESLRTSFDRQQNLFNLQQEQLIAEFVALESAMSQLQSTSSFLASQLGGISSLQGVS
ncbi:MAG: flagellar filament capping protein FliD [Planctomycetaceae bacterium]|nr:flagellar filament capping protein FliD [Planctomycetaceae bacterium]